MKELRKGIEELQVQLRKHRRSGLKELPTRTIFIDPLLGALGWNVRDPDEVELEYPTIDNKAVDFALKIGKKPVILLEAKALDDPLDDVKAITQVVGYATNDGIDWCILTNGIRYKVYRSSEKVPAPEKLLFEVTIDPEIKPEVPLEQIVSHLSRLSKASMARGVLDELGEEIFTTAKVRKALDLLFSEQDDSFIRVIRKAMIDDTISPAQIRSVLPRIWRGETPIKPSAAAELMGKTRRRTSNAPREIDYGEAHHTEGKPAEVVELYRALDRFCQDRAAGNITRIHKAKHIGWAIGNSMFCSVHLLQSGLKMWLKLPPSAVPSSVAFARDVSQIGHWGVGDVEFAIDSQDRLREAERYIQASFDSVMKTEA